MLECIRSRHAIVAMMLLGLTACLSDPAGPSSDSSRSSFNTPTLRQVASTRGVRVGAAVDRLFREDAEGNAFKTVLSREFSVLTPENDMKHRRLQPSRGVFVFTRADSLVAFAESHDMDVRGHTLVWHYGNAAWLTARTWTNTEARALLTEHVRIVVEHYRGRIFAWDVVNEAINDDGTLRPSIWSNAIGAEFVELAFRAAHQADPQALLFYNDYNIEDFNAKSDSVYAMIARLVAAGVPIHGIGFQGHFRVGAVPTRQAMAANLARFAALGLKLHFTEVDVSVPQPSTTAQLETQAENYRIIFDVCLQNLACQMVVTWGVTDGDSWISRASSEWGEPLLFDNSYRPKAAYWSIHKLFTGQ
jgi:endo-1,4-beta-xylanase